MNIVKSIFSLKTRTILSPIVSIKEFTIELFLSLFHFLSFLSRTMCQGSKLPISSQLGIGMNSLLCFSKIFLNSLAPLIMSDILGGAVSSSIILSSSTFSLLNRLNRDNRYPKASYFLAIHPLKKNPKSRQIPLDLS